MVEEVYCRATGYVGVSSLGGHSHRAVHRKQSRQWVEPSHVPGMFCLTERQPKSRTGSRRERTKSASKPPGQA